MLTLILSSACTQQTESSNIQALKEQISVLQKKMEDLKPGLGEIMSTIHLHHAKLYFSGQNENWELASYQVDEIKEGLDQATELHDDFKDLKGSLKELRHLTDQSIAEINAAIKDRNKVRFMSGFRKLTVSCNQCHQAASRGFIVILQPTAAMFTNQKFTKEK
ncbi:MAG: hypothetical protein C5B49_09440 [Bdellovibrio sp.]|nr:MAG: hypothetical protein C5B49_09440 [Bdellovibrio sp.]